MAKPPRIRRLFQFGLKTLLLLTMVCAALLAGWRFYIEPYHNQTQARTVPKRLKATVQTRRVEAAAWQRWFLDEEDLITVTKASLQGTELTDTEAAYFASLLDVEELHLAGTKVTDDGLPSLRGLTRLKTLYLYNTEVTDAGLEHLAPVVALEKLYLGGTRITHDGLRHLRGLTNLRILNIHTNGIRKHDAGVVELQAALPKVKISL